MDRPAPKIKAGSAFRENTYYDSKQTGWIPQKSTTNLTPAAKAPMRTPFASIPLSCEGEGYGPSPGMGWSQPNAGKRLRDDSQSDRNSELSTATSESETDEEVRMHLVHKRSRDASPIRSSPAVMDFNALTGSCCSSGLDHNNRRRAEIGDYMDSYPVSSMGHEEEGRRTTLHGEYYSTDSMADVRGRSGGDSPYNFETAKMPQVEAQTSLVYSSDNLSDDTEVFKLPTNNSMRADVFAGRPQNRVAGDNSIFMSETSVDSARITSKVSSNSSSSSSLMRFKGLRVSAARRSRLSYRKYLSPPSNNGPSGSKGTTKSDTIVGGQSDDEEESESEIDDSTVDDLMNIKSEEVLEDDASTSTDMNVPNVVKKIVPAIRPSYFPFVPPYLNFCSHEEKSDKLPNEIAKHLKWRLSTITPVVIRKTVSNTGFRLLKNTVEWGGQWGKHMKSAVFRSSLKDYQKLNHLPATFQLGRKDRLWKNIYRFILKYGKNQFGFLPRTFVLPHDMKQLKHIWNSCEAKGNMWIIKPPAGARGTGIRVVSKWNQVPKKRPVIVQQYIAKPLLINDRKFDLRLYVLVTSSHPLRMYLFEDGLVRFAPVKYSHDTKRVSDRFMHLTNYSVNKNCELYTQNEDANACKGHKWTLKSLWRYLQSNGKDPAPIIEKIEDIVIKTFLSAEECITNSTFNLPNKYCGYELFGFDVILDENLKPWLLEVNISPSLHSSSPLDLAVKGPLVKEVFNIVGYHLPPTLSKHAKKLFIRNLDQDLQLDKPTFDKRLYSLLLSKEEKQKHSTFKPKFDNRNQYLTDILSSLTPDDMRQLIIAEDELSQCNGFRRIFPTGSTHSYFGFFEGPRYYNMLMDAWETKYENDRRSAISRLKEMCQQKLHLITEPSPAKPILNNQGGSEFMKAVAAPITSLLHGETPNATPTCATVLYPGEIPVPASRKQANIVQECDSEVTKNTSDQGGGDAGALHIISNRNECNRTLSCDNVIPFGDEDNRLNGNSLDSNNHNASSQSGVTDFAHFKRMCC